jgi:hypothetical protein
MPHAEYIRLPEARFAKPLARALPAPLLAAALLASCGTYSPPPGATSRIKFIGSPGYAYIDYGNSCKSRRSVEGDLLASAAIRDGVRVWIEHGFDAPGLASYQRCSLTYSFVPQPDTTYVSSFTLHGPSCSMILYRLSPSGTQEIEPAITKEPDLNCEKGVAMPVIRP